jgi:hypothetical protein
MKPRVQIGLMTIILTALAACCTAIYLIAPPPAPKVAFVIGPTWRVDGTNIIIRVDLATSSINGVEFDDIPELLVETPSGWKIAKGSLATATGGWIAPGAAKSFSIPVPGDAQFWMVSARYHFYRQSDFHRQVLTWIDRSGLCELAPEFANRMKQRHAIFQLNTPTQGVVKSDCFTNLPPVLPWPPQ